MLLRMRCLVLSYYRQVRWDASETDCGHGFGHRAYMANNNVVDCGAAGCGVFSSNPGRRVTPFRSLMAHLQALNTGRKPGPPLPTTTITAAMTTTIATTSMQRHLPLISVNVRGEASWRGVAPTMRRGGRAPPSW